MTRIRRYIQETGAVFAIDCGDLQAVRDMYTVVGAPTVRESPLGGFALDFDGASGVGIGIDVIAPLVNGASGVSVSAFIRYRTIDAGHYGSRVFVAKINGASTGIGMLFRGDAGHVGDLLVGGRSQAADGFQEHDTIAHLTANVWYHIVGVLDFDGDTISIYIDGELDSSLGVAFGSDTFVAGVPTAIDSIGYEVAAPFWDGAIKDTIIWPRVLTVDEVRSLHNNTFFV